VVVGGRSFGRQWLSLFPSPELRERERERERERDTSKTARKGLPAVPRPASGGGFIERAERQCETQRR